jgi:hypothetical protein
LKGITASYTFVDYWFLSLSILTTLGSDVVPQSHIAKMAEGVEVILGIAWTVIVFAAVLSVAQKLRLAEALASDSGAASNAK